ncbi:MAG: class II aldolase/adducin family protein [Ignavibacteria bacterium]|nr:class II aldolase/adducin family protein [Ignavibacteria bacterium]
MSDEGYIKFKLELIEEEIEHFPLIYELTKFRSTLWDLGLIGTIGNVSYGNLSHRLDDKKFIITGTNTGAKRLLDYSDFVVVIDYDIENNFVLCKGRTKPSSETLTHSAVYKALPKINVVLHFHNKVLWETFRLVKPTTSSAVDYGSVGLAREITKICNKINHKEEQLIVLGGHKDGILTFSENINELEMYLINLLAEQKQISSL